MALKLIIDCTYFLTIVQMRVPVQSFDVVHEKLHLMYCRYTDIN